MIEATINAPHATRPAFNRLAWAAATAFFRRDGAYVVRDDDSGAIIQVGNRNDPLWIPDSSIRNPYRP